MATKVVLAARPIKTTERIDKLGNIINPRTKQIIQSKEDDYVPPIVQPQEPQTISQPPISTATPMIQVDPMSIQNQIAQAKENLKNLQELKRLKIQEMKETIKLLKK